MTRYKLSPRLGSQLCDRFPNLSQKVSIYLAKLIWRGVIREREASREVQSFVKVMCLEWEVVLFPRIRKSPGKVSTGNVTVAPRNPGEYIDHEAAPFKPRQRDSRRPRSVSQLPDADVWHLSAAA